MSAVGAGLATQLALLLSGPAVARMLGVEDRGHLAFLLLWPAVLVQLGTLGLPLAVTYFIAREPSRARAIARTAALPALLTVAMLVPLHLAILLLTVWDEREAVRTAALLTLPLIPATAALNWGLAVLQGQQRFRAFNLLRTAPPAVYAMSAVVMMLCGGGPLPAVTLLWVGPYMLVALIALIVTARGLPRRTEDCSTPSQRQVLTFGLKGLLGSVSPVETFRVDQAIVGLFLSPAALGLYVAGLAFTNLPRNFISEAVGKVAYPHVAAQPDTVSARRAMWRFFWVALAACTAVVAALEVVAGWLVPFFFGDEFAGAAPVMRILLISSLFLGARRVLADCSRGAGQPGLSTIAELASWLVLFPTLGAFMAWWGIKGVALSLTVSSGFSLAVLLVLVLGGGRRAAGTRTAAHAAEGVAVAESR